MGLSNFRINVIARLLALTGLLFTATWGALNTDWQVTPLICIVLAIAGVIELIHYVESLNRELAAFLEFIRHHDFSFRFPIGEKGRVFEDLEGAYTEILQAYRDLNREKAVNHRYLESLVEHVHTALLCLDENGGIRLMNEQAKRLFATPQLPSLKSLKRIDPALPERLLDLRDGSRAMINVTVDGERLQLALFATEFELLGQHYKLISFQNIRDELEQREVDFSQKLIRVMTHEIMNSVTPIIALSKVIEDSIKAGSEPGVGGMLSLEDKDDLLRSAASIQSRGSGLLRFVQAYSTLTNLPRPRTAHVDVAKLLEQVDTLMKPDLQAAGIVLTTDLEEPGLSVTADPDQIQQVLINLVKNASEALADTDSGRVVLRGSRDGEGRVTVQVIDNGPGIDESQLGNIFVPFFTTKRSGTGIGLSISRQIMALNKGFLSVKTALGRGAEFTLRFR